MASGAILEIGTHFKIMDMCNIGCFQNISIGAQSWIVHRCQVFDTNFHYIADFAHGIVRRWAHPIIIGSYCWICNSSTITGGARIPDKTIVASNSLVNKDMSQIPEESIIGGVPAKLLSSGYRKIENKRFEMEVSHFFETHPNVDLYKIPEGTLHEICDVAD